MLAYVGYTSLRADVFGSLVSTPYIKPTARTSEFIYTDSPGIWTTLAAPLFVGDMSVLSLDNFDVPNRWVLTVSQPGKGPPWPLLSQYDLPPSDPFSAANRGRVIADGRSVDVIDQATLDGLVKLEAEESQANRHKLKFSTPLMPHDWADCFTIDYARLPASEPNSRKWIEESWTFPMIAGGVMDHVVCTVLTAT
jgi:hypothetical protein